MNNIKYNLGNNYVFDSGIVCSGNLKEDKLEGNGIQIENDGKTIMIGEWREGNFNCGYIIKKFDN